MSKHKIKTREPDPNRDRATSLLNRLGVSPNKVRGQNFLIDDAAIASIVNFIAPSANQNIIEIGPGLGVLTEQLAGRGLSAVIELESAFAESARERFKTVEVINQDVRRIDFSRFPVGSTVVGNLPYSLSTEIVFHLLSFPKVVARAVFMLQKEFVTRMVAQPGGRDFGVLSIGVQMRADLRLGPQVSGTSFYPITQVASQVIELRLLKEPRYPVADIEGFMSWVSAAFNSRRRTLVNSLSGASGYTEEQVAAALKEIGLSAEVRPEQISIPQSVAIYDALRRSSYRK